MDLAPHTFPQQAPTMSSEHLQQRLNEKTDHIAMLTKKIDNMSKEARRKDMRVEAERRKVHERDEKILELQRQLQNAQEINHAMTKRKSKAKEQRRLGNERVKVENLERERELRIEASSLRGWWWWGGGGGEGF